MNIKSIVVATLMLVAVSANACQPNMNIGGTDIASIKKRLRVSKAVLIAVLENSDKANVKQNNIDFPVPTEIDTFVVKHVFKGSFKIGERFTLTTTLSGCGRSAVNDPAWIISTTDSPAKVDKEWLLYIDTLANTQITDSSLTRPIDMVGQELEILRQLTRAR